MTAHVLTKAELQAWVDVLADDQERKAMQAKLDTDPDWGRNKIEKAMQAAFDELVEKGVLTSKGSMSTAKRSTAATFTALAMAEHEPRHRRRG